MKLVYLSAPLDNQHDDTKKKNIFGVMEAEGQNKKTFLIFDEYPVLLLDEEGSDISVVSVLLFTKIGLICQGSFAC